nr:hypothetical protein LRH_11724 [Lacticaseibacillus rhamnosus HN001]
MQLSGHAPFHIISDRKPATITCDKR